MYLFQNIYIHIYKHIFRYENTHIHTHAYTHIHTHRPATRLRRATTTKAGSCSVLQCVAACCGVLQCVAVFSAVAVTLWTYICTININKNLHHLWHVFVIIKNEFTASPAASACAEAPHRASSYCICHFIRHILYVLYVIL